MPVNPNPEFYKRTVLSPDDRGIGRTAFYFDSFLDFERFIEKTTQNAESNSRAAGHFRRFNDPRYAERKIREDGEGVFGTQDPTQVTAGVSSYLFNNELDTYIGNLRQRTVNIDVTDIDQSKNIRFTSREVGIFSFDLASLGLIKVFEFYSPVLKRFVAGNNVITEKDENGQTVRDSSGQPVFFHKYKPEVKEHEVMWNAEKGGYFSPLLDMVIPQDQLVSKVVSGLVIWFHPHTDEIQKHIVERRQKIDEKGKPMWATTYKKVFIEIPKIEKTLPRLDIIVTASYSYDKNARTQLLWSSMAAIALAEKLSKSSVNYRIIVAYPVLSRRGSPEKKVFTFVNVKKEGEPLDKNRMGLLISDGRMFRYTLFKGFVASLYDAGFDEKISDGIGAPINDSYIPLKNDNGKFVSVNIDNAFDANGNIRPVSREYDTEEELERDENATGRTVNQVKNAYIDFLANSSNPADREAAKNRSSKIVFSGALSEQAAINQYNLVINQITKVT